MADIESEDLTIGKAKRIVAKFSDPDYVNKEQELLKQAAAKLLEDYDPDFELDEEDEEEEEVKESRLKKEISTGIKEGGSAIRKSTMENITQYAGEIISNVQNLGAAGSVAFGSATYFQAETVVQETQEVAAIIETVEVDYGQTLSNWVVESTAEFIQDIPVVNKVPVVNDALASAGKSLLAVADKMETLEEREERKEAKAAEKAAKIAEKNAEKIEKAEAKAKVKAEQIEAKKAEREKRISAQTGVTQKESNSEETTEVEESEVTEESNSEETTEVEESEVTEESTEEVESDNQPKENTNDKPKEESKNEESNIKTNSSETKPNVQTDSFQGETNDSTNVEDLDDSTTITPSTDSIDEIDPIKPHSMVGDDAFDFPKVETPNTGVQVVSPSNAARPVSPTN